jgi:hypothetical protein
LEKTKNKDIICTEKTKVVGEIMFSKIRSISWKILKWLAIIFCASAAIELILLSQWHKLPPEKNSGFTMIQRLSEVKNMTSKCWAGEGALDISCNARIKALLKTEGGRNYFRADRKLIGVDFENKVVVILSLNKEENDLRWRCAGAPATAIPSSCSAL